jgi:p-aminobenzoyl-glutamate transporter AbgT
MTEITNDAIHLVDPTRSIDLMAGFRFSVVVIALITDRLISPRLGAYSGEAEGPPVLSAYRIGDSPTNSIMPLNAYFALVVGFARHYDAKAGIC